MWRRCSTFGLVQHLRREPEAIMNPFEAETVDAEWSQRDAARWWRERGVREATAESTDPTTQLGMSIAVDLDARTR